MAFFVHRAAAILLLLLLQCFSLSSSSPSSSDSSQTFTSPSFFQRRVLLFGPNNSSGTFGLMTTPTERQPLTVTAAEPRLILGRRLDNGVIPPHPQLLDKLDLRLEAGAKRWQEALNASLGEITTTTTTAATTTQRSNTTSSAEIAAVNHLQPPPPPSASNLLKANEIAHSEPLKTINTYGHGHGHHHPHHHHSQNHHHPHHHRAASSSSSSSSSSSPKKKKKNKNKVQLNTEENTSLNGEEEEEDGDLPPLEFDDFDEEQDSSNSLAGSTQAPACAAASGKHYCSFKEEGAAYPAEVVAKIAQFYRYPLQSLFGTALSQQVMPQLANDAPSGGGTSSSSVGAGLVCEATTRLVRVGWAMNTSGRWLAVLNTDHYQQYVTEVLCGQANAACHYVPPCYQASCTQRYNTQKLLVVDPAVPHRGPFLSEFLFPSCCVCHVKALAGEAAKSKSGATYSKTPADQQQQQRKAKA